MPIKGYSFKQTIVKVLDSDNEDEALEIEYNKRLKD